jgi:hypothetical protein
MSRSTVPTNFVNPPAATPAQVARNRFQQPDFCISETKICVSVPRQHHIDIINEKRLLELARHLSPFQ